MKKGILMIIFFILIVGFIETSISSCASSSQKDEPNSNTNTSSSNTSDNTVSNNNDNDNIINTTNTEGDKQGGEEIDWSKAESKIIVGKIEYGMDNKVAIVEKWDSRSRVSYYVYGEYKSSIETALKNAEKSKSDVFTKVKGLVPIKSSSPWTKAILIEEILETSNTPIEVNE